MVETVGFVRPDRRANSDLEIRSSPRIRSSITERFTCRKDRLPTFPVLPMAQSTSSMAHRLLVARRWSAEEMRTRALPDNGSSSEFLPNAAGYVARPGKSVAARGS